MKALMFSGNQEISTISAEDRGLAYGDGIFETILAQDAELVWWPEHWQRLVHGAERLGIALPNQTLIHDAALQLASNTRCVIKLILTRGISGRGYMPQNGPATTIVSVFPKPNALPTSLALRWCNTIVVQQPALAGLKHLNRLENVLARTECASAYDEGLMCNRDGLLISATSANVFIYRDGRWLTPDLSESGIAGIARQWVLAHAPYASIDKISRVDVENADAVFLCNAVRGMMAVSRIGQTDFPEHAALTALKQKFLAQNPAFASE